MLNLFPFLTTQGEVTPADREFITVDVFNFMRDSISAGEMDLYGWTDLEGGGLVASSGNYVTGNSNDAVRSYYDIDLAAIMTASELTNGVDAGIAKYFYTGEGYSSTAGSADDHQSRLRLFFYDALMVELGSYDDGVKDVPGTGAWHPLQDIEVFLPAGTRFIRFDYRLSTSSTSIYNSNTHRTRGTLSQVQILQTGTVYVGGTQMLVLEDDFATDEMAVSNIQMLALNEVNADDEIVVSSTMMYVIFGPEPLPSGICLENILESGIISPIPEPPEVIC